MFGIKLRGTVVSPKLDYAPLGWYVDVALQMYLMQLNVVCCSSDFRVV